jgi:hypothetical protein
MVGKNFMVEIQNRNELRGPKHYEGRNELRGSKRITRVEKNYEGRNELRGSKRITRPKWMDYKGELRGLKKKMLKKKER